MDFSVILIGVVTISILVLPFFVAAYSNKNRKKKLSNNYLSKSQSFGLNISEHDVLFDAVIGIDQTKRVLFYFNTKENYHELIDLNRVLRSSVKKHDHTVGTKKDAYTVTDRIELELALNDQDNTIIAMKFYDNDVIFQLNGELQIAEKWQKVTQPQYNTIVEPLNVSESRLSRIAG